MKTYSIYILLFVLNVSQAYSQTLDDYLKTAAENNPHLKATYLQFEASLKRVAQVNALPNPSLSFGVFVSPIETRVGAQQAKISLNQRFPWFGTIKAKTDVVKLQAEAKYQTFLDAKNLLYLNVKEAYYPLYKVKRHIALMQAYLNILETYKELALTSVSNGKATMTDVIRVDILTEDIKTDIQILNDKLTPYVVSFNRLLNRSDSATIFVPDSLPTVLLREQFKQDSIQSNPKIQALNYQIQAKNSLVKVSKKMSLPQFGLGLDYAFIKERSDVNIPDNGKNAFMPMLSMTLPIYRKKYKAAVNEAELLKAATELEKENTTNTLVSGYESALFQLKKEQQLASLYRKQLEKTQQMVELLYVAYSNSGKDFEEVLRMQQQLLKYQIALSTSQTELYIAMAKLHYLISK